MKRYKAEMTLVEYGNGGKEITYVEDSSGDYSKYSEVEQLQALTKEFARGVIKTCIQYDGDWGECIYCHEAGWGYPDKHKDYCEAGKAHQYLDSLKEKG